MEELIHWKKLHNYDYLGAYSLEEGKDMILTIKELKKEVVTGPNNRKEQCVVMYFMEDVKPMIVNRTNSKTIEKIAKTPYIQRWTGCKIQLFSEIVTAFGTTTDALRVRPYAPKQDKISTICSNCEKNINAFGKTSAEQVAQHTYKKYGKQLCAECAEKENNIGKAEDVL